MRPFSEIGHNKLPVSVSTNATGSPGSPASSLMVYSEGIPVSYIIIDILGDTVNANDFVFIKAFALLQFSKQDKVEIGTPMLATPIKRPSIFTSPSSILRTPTIAASISQVPSTYRQLTDVLFLLHNTRLLIGTTKELDSDVHDSVLATLKMIAPIMHAGMVLEYYGLNNVLDVAIDSSTKKSLELLVRSLEIVGRVKRVGTNGTEDNAPSTPAIVFVSAANNGVYTPPVNIQSRQLLLKHSPCALLGRAQSTLWQVSLSFEYEEDCAAVARHVDIQRQQIRGVKLHDLRKYLESIQDNAAVYH